MQEADITKVAPQYVGETAFPTVTFAALTLLAYILGFVAAITGAIPLGLGLLF